MTDPIRDVADSQHADSETAECQHQWQPDDTRAVPVNGATNVRYCPRCDALDWDDHPSCVCRDDKAACPVHDAAPTNPSESEPLPPDQPTEGAGLTQIVPPTFDPYVKGAAGPFDPVANLSAAKRYIEARCAIWQEQQLNPPVVLEAGQTYEATYAAPSAYQRGMQIASGRDADADLDTFRVAVTRGERWPIDRIGDDHLDLLYTLIRQQTNDLRAVMERGNPDTWERQANEIGRLVRDLQNSQQEATGARDELSDLRLRLHRIADDLTKPSHANIPPHMIAGSIWGAIEAPPLDDTPETM